MIPCLYGQGETNFLSNGIGKLSDAVSCSVVEKRNGSYELTMTYPSEGIHAENLIEENIIVAKPSEHGSPQPFRIYKITTLLNGFLEINARHIQYQQNQITVSPFTAHGAQAAMTALSTNAATNCPFTFVTDITNTDDFTLKLPSTIRNCLGNMENSILDIYGGEFEWDMYTTILHVNRGADNGVRIVYGKNLIDFQMEKSIESMLTGVHPYWYKKDDDTGAEIFIELPEKIMTLNLGQTYERIETLDCSSIFSEQPTLEEIRDYARWYLQDEKFSRPDADITVNFVQLWQMPGYEDIAEAESVSLCDTVHVYIVKLNTVVSYKVTETDYNVLLERYNSITLSNANKTSRNVRNSYITRMTSLQSQAATALRNSNSNSTKLKQLSYKFADEISGLYSELEMTAAYLRTQFRNEHDQLTSRFEQTAEHFRWELEDGKRQLSSQMELTAYHLQTDFNDKLNGLHSEFEVTAAHLRTDFTDELNQLSSHFEITAEHLQTSFEDRLFGFKSEVELNARHLQATFTDRLRQMESTFELSAQHMQASFTDRINGLESTFELNAAHLRTEFYNQVEGLQAEFEVNARNLNYATTKADENGNILAKAGLYIGTDGNIAYNYNAVNGVGTQFQQHADAIGTVVGTYNGRYFIKAGEVVDSINAQTGQTIHKVDMDKITLKNNAIIGCINDGPGAGETALTINFNRLNLSSGALIKVINGGGSNASSLKIDVGHLEVTGLATVGSLNTEKARIDNLVSGVTKASILHASSLKGDQAEVTGLTVTDINQFTVAGDRIGKFKVRMDGIAAESTFLGTAAVNLAHSHSITTQEITSGTNAGKVKVTLGAAVETTSNDRIDFFDIAGTQTYLNGVSAARPSGIQSSLTLGSGDIGTSSKYITVFCADDEEYDFPINIDASAVYRAGKASVTPIVYFNGYEKQSDGEWETVGMDNHTIYLEPGEYSNVYVQYYNHSTSSWVTKMGKYEATVGQGTCTFAYRYSNIGTQFQVHINGVSSGLYGVLEYDDGYVYMRDADTGYDYARVYVANLV